MESIEVVAETFDGSGQFGGRNLGFGGHCVFFLRYDGAASRPRITPDRSVEHHDHTRIGWLGHCQLEPTELADVMIRDNRGLG